MNDSATTFAAKCVKVDNLKKARDRQIGGKRFWLLP
jgi:hypothetical protein